MKHWLLTTLIIFLLPLVACGKPEEAPVPNQQAIVDCAETMAAHQYLLKQHEELETLYERAKAREAEYLTAVRILEDANLALGIELGIVKSIEEGRRGGYEDLLNELASLRAEKKEWGIFASQEYSRILEQYNELAALYPPKNFPDRETLVDWRANTGNVTELGCLGLQRLAMEDGYLVSVHPGFEYCVAIADDYWYKITLGDKNLVEKIGKVK